MSHTAAPSNPLPASSTAGPDKAPLTFAMIIGIAGLTVFLDTQICIVAGAAVWAISGYFHFGRAGFATLGMVTAPATLYLCWKILIMAIDAERDPANN